MKKVADILFGSKHERDIAKLRPILAKINALEEEMKRLSDAALLEKTEKWRAHYQELAAPSDAASRHKDLQQDLQQDMQKDLHKDRHKDLQQDREVEGILPPAYAMVREAAVRALGLRLYDVQLIGALALNQGKIAEMKTGEGKTLAATAAVYFNALKGQGVHVVTVNDYLAKRDAEWMQPVYETLGLSVGVIQASLANDVRQRAYAKDITYGTNNEFGFDYLRDNMVTHKSHRVQRGHYFAIVDEVDSILVDEARTPLIISGAGQERSAEYQYVNKIMERFVLLAEKAPPPPEKEVMPGKEEPHIIRGFYYDIDEKGRNVFLTEEGIQYLEKALKLENLYAPEHASLIALIQQSLKAHLIFRKEVDYVIQQGEVLIVDEHTGRTLAGRRYGEGLHQAIEAKERVKIRQESQTMASITFQNYFRLYRKLSGMTGTAETEAEEFRKIYGLNVLAIPTHLSMMRNDFPDRVYANEPAKFKAMVDEVADCVTRKQPVLMGTISIEKSEELSKLLSQQKIQHSVLNAKHHSSEAEIIANAGAPGRVTVATNMAGRGTDIVLGSSPQYLEKMDALLLRIEKATASAARKASAASKDSEASAANKANKASAASKDSEDQFKVLRKMRGLLLQKGFTAAQSLLDANVSTLRKLDGKLPAELTVILTSAKNWLRDHELVKEAGGLHIIGTERHDARRIDNQLRGRSGRQGDPGSSRFYLSLEDHLMRIFGGERIRNLMGRMGMQEDQELEARMVDKAIVRAQKRVENHHFDIRKHLLDYDEVMNTQRGFVYTERNRILEQDRIHPYLLQWMEDAFEVMILQHCAALEMETWDLTSLSEWLAKGLRLPQEMTVLDSQEINQTDVDNPQKALLDLCFGRAKNHYEEKVKHYEENGFPDFSIVECRIALDVLDTHWKDHLRAIDHLREGVWASGYAERNPLVEFKIEGFKLFDQMIEAVKIQITEYLFCVQLQKEPLQSTQYTGARQGMPVPGAGPSSPMAKAVAAGTATNVGNVGQLRKIDLAANMRSDTVIANRESVPRDAQQNEKRGKAVTTISAAPAAPASRKKGGKPKRSIHRKRK